MRRLAAFSLAVCLAAALVPACGGSDGSSEFSPPEDAATGDVVGRIPDGGGPLDTGLIIGKDGGAGGDAGATCPGARTCQQLGIQCGMAGDGCGGTMDCGSCQAPAYCGGGGPSKCGAGNTTCKAKTCQQIGATCGKQGDGCGGTIDCGTCTSPQTCGGGGTPNQCGVAMSSPDSGPPPGCTPKTCQQLGATCGQLADGCGGLTPNCGNCVQPAICGGGGVPNQCGDSNLDGGVGQCTNLCPKIPQCDSSAGTTISGRVVAPTPPQYGNPDPLYGALVYIPNSPNGALDPFPNTVSCDQCGAQASGQPLVSATTDANGRFQLKNVPAGSNIPLVLQLGRWRREIVIPTVNPCVDNPLTQDQTRMPRKQQEGSPYDNIPLTAMVTGSVDALECVLRKIGIDDTQFGNPTSPAGGQGSPRVQFYKANGQNWNNPNTPQPFGGSVYNGSTPLENSLWSSADTMKQYDQILFACEGGEADQLAPQLANAQAYTDAGGRIYATHYSYTWIFENSPWNTTANWGNVASGNNPNDPTTGIVDQSFAKGQAFAQWLVNAGASAVAGQVSIGAPRSDFFTPIQNGGQQWLYTNDPSNDTPLHYTFNTPVNAQPAQQCGRVLYSDFHVTNASTNGTTFPNECTNGPMTAQEKVLEFMIFDLASCIQAVPPPPPPTCTPLSCQQQNIQCGPAGDGCGNVIQCGMCAAGQACGAGGPSQCGPINNNCTPLTCQQIGSCGQQGDGCGNLIDCPCPAGQTCGGGGVNGQCGTPPCTKVTCQQAMADCGQVADGCGGTMDCGTCSAPCTCGGGGTPNQCGGCTR